MLKDVEGGLRVMRTWFPKLSDRDGEAEVELGSRRIGERVLKES